MSDVSKKIAMFNQKNVNNTNNNSSNVNNNINKKSENKGKEEIKSSKKNEILKLDERRNTKIVPNNNSHNNSNTNKNINNNQNNKFQNKLSVFEKNNESKTTNNNKDLNKKEYKSIEKNQIVNNNNNTNTNYEPKLSTADKINIFNTNTNKKNEKLSAVDKINIFNNNNKKEEPKINSFTNNKKEEPKINSFTNNKKEEPKALSDRINIFNTTNKKTNEPKTISKEKNEINKSNKKENEAKSIFSNKINIFNTNNNSNKKEKENEQKIETNNNTNNRFIHNVKNKIEQLNNNSKNDKKEDDIELNSMVRKSHVNHNNNNIFKTYTLTNNSYTNKQNNNIKKLNSNIIANNSNATNTNNINNNLNNNINNNLNNNINNNLNNNINNNLNNNININQEEKIKETNNTQPENNIFNSPVIIGKTSSKLFTPSNNQNEVDEIGQIFLNLKQIPETVVNDTFCMGFFITSFNLENPQMIENTNELLSDCGHTLCTNALSIKPEIIFRYPKNDTNDFEISELGASICFPNGIKMCYAKNENHVRSLKNYSSVLTNQTGKRYYMMTYHYYLKITTDEFDINNEYFSSLDSQLMENFNTCEYVYIPYCLSILTKYPYFSQVDKCLESIRFTLENYHLNPSEIYNIIIYLLKSIPVPPIGTKLFFPIPYYNDLISINQPFYKDIILFGDNPVILLEYLSVEEIIIIFRLLLFEQKIIIVGNNYDDITKFTYNFILLLYPLQWVHTYISILTEKMLKYLQSFLPFFFGMHSSLYELTANILESTKENIFIIDISKRSFEMNTFPTLNSKNIIKKINELVPQLPKNIYNNMTFGLGILKSYYDKKKEQKSFNLNNVDEMMPINTKIKHVFIQTFIEILYDYKNFLSMINNKPIFNTNGLLEKRPKNESNFYKELTETQLFQMFIQNNPVNVTKNNETFFEEQLESYSNLKIKTDFREEFINNSSILCEIYKHYIIQYESLEDYDLSNNKKLNLKREGELTLNDYKKSIKQKYFKYDIYFKPNVIMKVNKRVITNKIVLELNKIPPKYNFYIIPNQEFNFEVEKRKKSIQIKASNTNTNTNKQKFEKNNKIEKEKELTPEQKDDIKENIVDVLTKIFKNEEISDIEDSKKLILDSLDTNYGKELYTSILYKNNNISNESSFKFLKDIIYRSIMKMVNLKNKEDTSITYIVKLIKSCNNFRKEENKKFIYLSDVLYKKFQKIQILEWSEFWKHWAEIDFEDQKNEKISMDEKWTKGLDDIEKTMIKMGFNKTMVYSTVANLAKENIKEETVFLKHMRKVVENLKIFKS